MMENKTDKLKIAVIGAGALGCVTACLLANSSNSVEIIDPFPGLAETVNQNGCRAKTHHGIYRTKIQAYNEIEKLTEPKDIIILATKAYNAIAAAKRLLPYLKPDSSVICFQNGMLENSIADVVGKNRTVACIVGWGATRLGLGEAEMTSKGHFVIGSINGTMQNRLHKIQSILSSIAPCYISGNIIGHTYSKLIINACITTLGAITGLYLGEMLAIKKIRRAFVKIIEESVALGNAMEITIPPYADKLDYYSFIEGTNWFAKIRRHIFLSVMGYKYRKLKSSSLQSLERGEHSEIDFLNGYIVKQATQLQVQVPFNMQLMTMVKEIETGKRKISLANMHEIAI